MKKFINDHIAFFLIIAIILSIVAIYQTIKVKDEQLAQKTARQKFIEQYKAKKAEALAAAEKAVAEKPVAEKPVAEKPVAEGNATTETNTEVVN